MTVLAIGEGGCLKTCTVCGKIKTINEFNRRKDAKDGRRQMCAMCFRAYRKSYRSVVMNPKTVEALKDIPTRVCSKCGVEKPITRFRSEPRNLGGHRKACLDCTRLAWKQADATRRERDARKRAAASEGFQKALAASREASEKGKALRNEHKKTAAQIKVEGLDQPKPKPVLGPIEAAIRDYRRAWAAITSLRRVVAS